MHHPFYPGAKVTTPDGRASACVLVGYVDGCKRKRRDDFLLGGAKPRAVPLDCRRRRPSFSLWRYIDTARRRPFQARVLATPAVCCGWEVRKQPCTWPPNPKNSRQESPNPWLTPPVGANEVVGFGPPEATTKGVVDSRLAIGPVECGQRSRRKGITLLYMPGVERCLHASVLRAVVKRNAVLPSCPTSSEQPRYLVALRARCHVACQR